MDTVLLKTARLTLRSFVETDLDNLFQLDNDPEVMRWINGGAPVARSDIQKEILPGFLHYDDDHPEFGFWAADDKTSAEFLGWFSFRPINKMGTEIALGYRLRRAIWGQGYATEGVHALIQKGFTELGVQRFAATTYEKNIASQRVMEKVGMTFVRRFRLSPEDLVQSDTHHVESIEVWDGDELEYALDKSDWENFKTVEPEHNKIG